MIRDATWRERMHMHTDVVLPVLDEAAALPWVLGRIPDGYRAIVVDNGSTDGSAQVAAAHGARVVHEPRRGFGAACYAGLSAATAQVVCFVDADGSMDPVQLPRVAEPVHAGTADLVLGARLAGRGAWPLHARLANRALVFELARRGHGHIMDRTSPADRRRVMDLVRRSKGDPRKLSARERDELRAIAQKVDAKQLAAALSPAMMRNRLRK